MPGHAYQFGPFRLDAGARVLLRDGEPVSITPKVFDTLAFLVSNVGRTVSREELIKAVWPDTFVEEGNLNYNMSQLRTILGESEPGTSYIQTIPKRGYRFVADISGPTATPSRKWMWLAAAAAVILIAGGVVLWRAKIAKPKLQQIRSIAVLPLRNLSRDPDQEYFTDGMTEALTTGLGQISALSVIAQSSMTRYSGTKKAPSEIARELNVDALVEGTVQRSGSRVMITAHLIDGSNDRQLWAKGFERDLRDALALQSEVAQAIAEEIRVKLTSQEQTRLARFRPVNPEAQDAYLRGVYLAHSSSNKRLVLETLQRAIQLDPNYAPAYAALAGTYYVAMFEGVIPAKEANAKWRAAVTRALELDDTLAEAHLSLAFLLHYDDWNWRDGERDYLRTVQLNPNLADAHLNYGDCLASTGRTNEALAETTRGLHLDPNVLFSYLIQGYALLRARRYDEAIEHGRKMLGLDMPGGVGWAHFVLGLAYDFKGVPTQAIEELQQALPWPEGQGYRVAALARAFAVSGRKGEALKELGILQGMPASPQHSYGMAVVYTALSDRDRAFEWLDKAYDERDYQMSLIKVDPRMDSLRADPRYAELLRRMGLPE